jgi:hypothetical protein
MTLAGTGNGPRRTGVETKGKTLQEVQEMWADPSELHRATHTWR